MDSSKLEQLALVVSLACHNDEYQPDAKHFVPRPELGDDCLKR